MGAPRIEASILNPEAIEITREVKVLTKVVSPVKEEAKSSLYEVRPRIEGRLFRDDELYGGKNHLIENCVNP